MFYSNKHTAKITPVKQDNFLDKSAYIIRQLRHLIIIQALLGISRLYLLKPKKNILWISYCYTFSVIALLSYSLFQDNYFGATYLVFKCTSCIEFIILACTSIFLQRRTLREFFKNLEAFDRVLNIENDIAVTMPISRTIVWILFSLLITSLELVILFESRLIFSMTNLTIMVHDVEQVFFGTMLRTILIRVRIVKAHVKNVCCNKPKDAKLKKGESLDKVEVLFRKAQPEISSLHEVYESLHKCSEQLNSIMSFPIMTMLLTSGLSTIILLKYAFAIFQENEETKDLMMLVFIVIRCLKYTVLVVAPCYFSSMTTTQVSVIRKTLHDALNNAQFDKIECRKLKAFFQLTRDSEFAYALWGVINLNMSLPLSYISLCTTYLVIIIQFSKFID